MAKAMGLDAIAITDHDTPSHLNQLPLVAGLRVVGGVEISAVHRRTNTIAHVLGYRIQEPGFVSTLTQPLLEARNATSEKQADILIRAGYRIDMDRIGRADGKYLYKQHILDWLVTTGQVADMYGAFYQKTFKNGGICDFHTAYNDVFEAVEAIKKAGGLAVLAHPGQQQNLWLVRELVELGLDGLELHHHANSPEDKEAIRAHAHAYHLFLTGGSDYHGKYEPHCIGDFLSDESGVDAVLR